MHSAGNSQGVPRRPSSEAVALDSAVFRSPCGGVLGVIASEVPEVTLRGPSR